MRSHPDSCRAPRRISSTPLQSRPSAAATAVAACLLVLSVAGAYANSLHGAFVLDDLGAIVHNRSLQSLSPRQALLGMPAGTTVSGRPRLNLSLAGNYALGGLSVTGFHALNLLIHGAATLALFGCVRRTLLALGQPSHPTLFAFSVALIWGVHPLQTESVTYVIQRAESLMGLFYLMSVYGFIRSAEPGATQAGRVGWAWVSVASCLLGAATKEVIATAPLAILLYDRAFLSGSFAAALRARWKTYLGLALSWLLIAGLIVSTGGNRSGTSGFTVGVSPLDYYLTQGRAVVTYLRLAVWPHRLVFEYGTFFETGVLAALPYLLPVAALAGVTTWTVVSPSASPTARRLGYLGVWFFGILSVTSLVPGIYQMIVEHRMYLPLASVAIALVALLWKAGWQVGTVASVAIAGAFLALTHARNHDYRDPLALWGDTVEKRPRNETAQVSLAVALFQAGKADEAIPHYQAALALKPDATDTLNDLGCAFLAVGRPADAVEPLAEAVRLKSEVAEYHFNLANALAAGGRLSEAAGHFRETTRLEPDNGEAHLRLALCLLKGGDQDGAASEYSQALRLGAGKDGSAR